MEKIMYENKVENFGPNFEKAMYWPQGGPKRPEIYVFRS